MKPLVVCYSYTGKTKKICGRLAGKLKADFAEIREIVRPSMISAYTRGGYLALHRGTTDIRPLKTDVGAYPVQIVASPVWAGNVPPAMNDYLREYDLIGKTVYGVLTCSARAGNAAERLREEIEKAGANCPNVVVLREKDGDFKAVESGQKQFFLEDGLLVLRDGDRV